MNIQDVNKNVADALLEHFPKCQIFHDDLQEGKYPAVVYSTLTEIPHMHADNQLYAWEKVIRITLVTNTLVGTEEMKWQIYDSMTQREFMWENTNTTKDGNEYYIAMDFSIGGLF